MPIYPKIPTYRQNYFDPKLKFVRQGYESVTDADFKALYRIASRQEKVCLECEYCSINYWGKIICHHKRCKGNVQKMMLRGLLCKHSTAPVEYVLELIEEMRNGYQHHA